MTTFSEDSPIALLKVPAPGTGAVRQTACIFQEMRGKRLSLESPIAVPSASVVSVEYEDALFLGEVIMATAVEGRWHLEVNVEQILSGLTSLVALRDQLLCDQPVRPMTSLPELTKN